MASSGVAVGGGDPSQNPHPTKGIHYPLSCTHCRQRKVKCDKVYPCSHCQRSNLTCVFPERARHPKKKRDGPKASNDELLNRLNRMEELIGKIEGDGKDGLARKSSMPQRQQAGSESPMRQTQSSRSPSIQSESQEGTNDNLNRYIGNTYLRSLTMEVEGLKESMDAPSEDEESPPNPGSDAQTPQSATVFGSTLSAPQDLRLLHPSPAHISHLCTLFIENVDPMFKVLHVPSLRNMVTDAISNVDAIPSGTYVECLLFAMYYGAITSLTAEECLQYFKDGKESLLAKYRAGTERALSNANMLLECDLGTLQALAIYLIAVRANDESMYSWTMLAVAVRLGHSLGLHREGSRPGLSPFVTEMRRRLWWQIIVLDVRCSEDVSTDPFITETSFNTKKPLSINDSDMDPERTEPIVERAGYTEMTKVMLSHDVSFLAWRVGYTPPTKEGEEPTRRTAESKMDLLRRLEDHIKTNILAHCDPAIPTAWVTSVVAQLILRRLRLAIYHPLQHDSRFLERPKVSRETMLKTAVECMEFSHLLDTEPIAARWRWFFKTYVQWHALAATLVELSVQTKGPLVERAWRIVDVVFDDTSNRIADSPNGMLWRPIKKLMSRAQASRNAAQMSSMSLNTQAQQQLPLPYFGTPAPSQLQTPSLASSTDQSSSSPIFDQNIALDQMLTIDAGLPSNDLLDLDMGESAGSINWAEWDQFMQDYQMSDQIIQPKPNPTHQEVKPLDNWW